MSSRLFSRCAGTSFSIGLWALASSHERRWVGPLVLDTMGCILIAGSNTYQKVLRMSAKTIENKVNRKSFIATNTDLPRFYHLIKTHKPGPAIKIRPIVSYTNGPTQRLSKKPLFVHHQSAIPEKSKINFIRNERKRIDDKCSTKATATKHQNMFDDILCLNGYPEGTINKTSTPRTIRKTRDLSTQNGHT